MPQINCKVCDKKFYARPSRIKKGKKYCSRDCMSKDYSKRLKGEGNPNYTNASEKVCLYCDTIFHSYDKKRKYCSLECSVKARNNDYTKEHMTDNNQPFIVNRLELCGYTVIDASDMAFGFPDIIVMDGKDTFLFEIKNPNNKYYGLTKRQKEWHRNWNGQVNVIYNFEDAISIINETNNIY